VSDAREPSDRLEVSIEAAPVRLDEPEVSTCEEHPGCVLFVEHYAVEMRLRDPGRPGVYVEPSGVVKVEVHQPL